MLIYREATKMWTLYVKGEEIMCSPNLNDCFEKQSEIARKENVMKNGERIIAHMCREYENVLEEYDYDYNHAHTALTALECYTAKQSLREMLRQSQYWDEELQMIVLKQHTILRSYASKGVLEVRDWAYDAIEDITEDENEICTRRSNLCVIFNALKSHFDNGDGKSNVIDFSEYDERDEFMHLPDDIKPTNGMKWSKYIGKVFKVWGLNHIVDMKEISWTDPATGEVRRREKDMGYNYHIALLGDSINPLEINGKTICISINLLDFITMSFGHDWSSCHTIDKENYRNCHHTYEGQYSSGTLSYALDGTSMIMYIVDEENKPNERRNEYHHYGKDIPYYFRDKEHRCVLSWENDKLYQGRVYPDGRDGGDGSIAGQLREIAQQIIAECSDASNIWTLKRGEIEEISDNVGAPDTLITTNCGATNYPDYRHYCDCTMSFLRRKDGELNFIPIHVGSKPICPSCGCRHEYEENILCRDCCGSYEDYCENCGAGIEDGEGIYVEAAGAMYCCVECAENAGYVCDAYGEWISESDAVYVEDDGEYYHVDDDRIVYCEDDDQYHLRRHCRQCDNCGDWFYDESEGISTYDGHWFHSEECAEEAEYVYCDDDDKWHHVG